MAVEWEWDIETVNSDGDIEDHDFETHLSTLLGWWRGWRKNPELAGLTARLVLVRQGGECSRLWAYAEDGDFERGEFQDCGAEGPIYPGVKIPKRYIAEYEKYRGEVEAEGIH